PNRLTSALPDTNGWETPPSVMAPTLRRATDSLRTILATGQTGREGRTWHGGRSRERGAKRGAAAEHGDRASATRRRGRTRRTGIDARGSRTRARLPQRGAADHGPHRPRQRRPRPEQGARQK